MDAPYNDFFPSLLTIVGFLTLAGVIWTIARKFTSLEIEVKNLRDKGTEQSLQINNKINDLAKVTVEKMAETILARKEEIAIALEHEKEDLRVIDKRIDSTRLDLKESMGKLHIIDTKVVDVEKSIDLLRDDVLHRFSFFTDWIQRIENRLNSNH